MEKCVLLVTHIDEGGIESGHDLLDFGQIDVAYRISQSAGLLLQGDQPPLFGLRYGDLLGLHVDYEFASHRLDYGLG